MTGREPVPVRRDYPMPGCCQARRDGETQYSSVVLRMLMLSGVFALFVRKACDKYVTAW